MDLTIHSQGPLLISFFFTLVTGPRRSLSLELSDTRVYEPQTEMLVPTLQTCMFPTLEAEKVQSAANHIRLTPCIPQPTKTKPQFLFSISRTSFEADWLPPTETPNVQKPFSCRQNKIVGRFLQYRYSFATFMAGSCHLVEHHHCSALVRSPDFHFR